MSVRINVKGEVVSAYLEGELDHHNAAEMRTAIDNAIELNMPSLLVLDFSGITFMDSSGIGLVMGRYKILNELGGTLEVTGLSDNSYKVMRLAGLDRIANIKKGGSKNGNK
jgi:stage II sporulation protein AA (anti-sigma F factor antagonist)